MTFRKLMEQVKCGQLKISTFGHQSDFFQENYLIERYNEMLDIERGVRKGKWNYIQGEAYPDTDKRMRSYLTRKLDTEIKPDSLMSHIIEGRECSLCGERLSLTFGKDGSLGFRGYFNSDGNFICYPLDYKCRT